LKQADATADLASAVLATMNRQGSMPNPDGAMRPASRMLATSPSETGSLVKERQANRPASAGSISAIIASIRVKIVL
jgi:hypothetical protein